MIDQVRSSSKFKNILEVILVIGNTLNQGTNKGEMQSFSMKSLAQLMSTKASDDKTTLMHYLAKVCSC